MELWKLILALIFAVVPLVSVHVVYVLWKAWRVAKRLGIETGVLGERLVIANITGAGATLLALVSLNSIFHVSADPSILTLVFILMFVLFSIPPVFWEFMYLTGRLE